MSVDRTEKDVCYHSTREDGCPVCERKYSMTSNEQCEHRTPDGGWTPWHFDQCPRCQIERLQRELAEPCLSCMGYQAHLELTKAENDQLRAALERLPITSLELIRLRNKGMITFDKQVAAIVDCLLDLRAALRPADEAPPAKDEVLAALRAGRVTYPPEVLPTGRWMPADETTGKPLGGYTCGACGRSFHYDEKHNCETCAGQETAACICRPVGAGDGDTYVPNPRCKAHK